MDGLLCGLSYIRDGICVSAKEIMGADYNSQSFSMEDISLLVRGCNCRLYTFSFLWPLLELLLLQIRRGIIITITGGRDGTGRRHFCPREHLIFTRGSRDLFHSARVHGYMKECSLFRNI